MKAVFRTIVALLLLGGWGLAALSLHLVRGTDASGGARWLLVPKDRLSAWNTFTDVRNWTLADVGRNPEVVKRLIALGKADVLTNTVPAESRGDLVQFLQSTLANPPPATMAALAPTRAPTTRAGD
jgi:hypothetical protein